MLSGVINELQTKRVGDGFTVKIIQPRLRLTDFFGKIYHSFPLCIKGAVLAKIANPIKIRISYAIGDVRQVWIYNNR
jgi:hypothetical protein